MKSVLSQRKETPTKQHSSGLQKPQKVLRWRPVRLSGRIKFRKSSSGSQHMFYDQSFDTEFGNDGKKLHWGYQFHNYCQHTSLHGFRYITEERRSIGERIFWICWCIFGISSAMYMMSKIWQKWQDNPVLTSIATTNLPVSEINFPAVTICPVNKAVSEKLIIQACRLNTTLSVMKQIISGLVDVESKNNDNDIRVSNGVDPREAMRYLRLVSPKCEDYLLRCELNGQKPRCSQIFKLMLTDSGYCCMFNAMEADSQIVVNTQNKTEIQQQEEEFEYLQKAVWQYHDKYRGIHGAPDKESNITELPLDTKTCPRTYDDDLFPNICQHINICRRDPGKCRLNVTTNGLKPTVSSDPMSSSSSSSTPGKNGSNIFRAPGSGRSRGLTIMTDTLRCDSIPLDSFKGIRVYVHGADEFPSVGEKGFIVGPGRETQVGVTAIDAFSRDTLKVFKPKNRECYFGDEAKLEYYKEYSRSSCTIECESAYIFKKCHCVPYYSPAAGNFSICGMKKMLDCVQPAIDEIQGRKSDRNGVAPDQEPQGNRPHKLIFNFDKVGTSDQTNACTDQCLPRCNETFYSIIISSASFPNQNEPNKTKLLREAIEEGFENLADINYVRGSISLLRIFFKESTILQYKRDELFTWEDFISNLGGVMSLCLGFSLLSLIEVIYFFTIRQINDKRNRQKVASRIGTAIMPAVAVIPQRLSTVFKLKKSFAGS